MLETREIQVITCDGCGREEWLSYGDMPEGWYTGEVVYHHLASGSLGGDWFACRPAHIKAAVIAAVERGD